MNEIIQITVGVFAGIFISLAVFFVIDAEVARQDYNENVRQCKAIDGCLFDYNCRKYNKMIEKDCE